MSEQINLWTERYRPKTLEDIVLSKEDREFFESLARKQEIPHLLFAGNCGLGKSSLSLIIVKDILKLSTYLYINASDEGNIETMRTKIANFSKTKSIDGKIKVVILDEACGMTDSSQRMLRGLQEECAENTRFILTCNYLNRIIPAIQSRCQIITLDPPLEETVKRIAKILQKENITISEDQKPLLLDHIRKHLPDIRRIVNDIQKFSINGTLNIRSDSSSGFALNIFKQLQKKKNLIDLRKEIIENERAFSNDYRSLLKELFEVVFESNLPYEKKTECLLIIAKGMEADSFIIDKEIGAFGVLINLARSIS